MKEGVWNLPTRARLAVARGALWLAWHFAWSVLVICCRPEHPTRVYVTGGRHTVLRSQLAALGHSTGPRWDRVPLPLMLAVTATLLLLVAGSD